MERFSQDRSSRVKKCVLSFQNHYKFLIASDNLTRAYMQFCVIVNNHTRQRNKDQHIPSYLANTTC